MTEIGDIPEKKITLTGLGNALKLYRYIKPFRWQFGAGIFFLFVSSAASLAFPKLLGELVSSGNQGNLADSINRIALLLLFILIIQSTFSYFRTIIFVNVTEKSLANLRQDTYNHLIKLPLSFFDRKL